MFLLISLEEDVEFRGAYGEVLNVVGAVTWELAQENGRLCSAMGKVDLLMMI